MRQWIGILLLAGFAQAEEITITSWNLGSGGESSSLTLAEQISQLPASDIWTFQEVKNRRWADELMWGVTLNGGDYDFQLGRDGQEERIMIVYNRQKVDVINKKEMRNLNDGGHRSPVVAEMAVKSNGVRFYLLVNHFARQKTSLRLKQATGLNKWASEQSMPIIATGTYNFDWKVTEGERKHDETFDVMTDLDVFKWIRPDILVRTLDADANEVQDFVLVSKLPASWEVTSKIVVRPNDFPRHAQTSDHRPVTAVLTMP